MRISKISTEETSSPLAQFSECPPEVIESKLDERNGRKGELDFLYFWTILFCMTFSIVYLSDVFYSVWQILIVQTRIRKSGEYRTFFTDSRYCFVDSHYCSKISVKIWSFSNQRRDWGKPYSKNYHLNLVIARFRGETEEWG